MQVAGAAGSVLLLDSRLWHCVAVNHSLEPRYAINVSYCAWWLNLQPTRVGTVDHTTMVVETEGKPNVTPPIPQAVYADLPRDLQPLVRHWVDS